MRLLIYTQYYWPENFRINEVAPALLAKGISVEVLTGKPNYPQGQLFAGYRIFGCQRELRDGITIHRVPLLGRGTGAFRLALNYLAFVVSGLLCAPWELRGKRYDVIFVYAPSPILQAIPAIFMGWIKKAPVVLWVQDLWPQSLHATGYVHNPVILKLVEWVVKFIYRNVDLLLVQSPAFEAPVRLLAADTPIAYYPNSVSEPTGNVSTVDVPEEIGLGKRFTVVFAGNIGSAQAVQVIVEAAAQLKDNPEINFLVLGEGSRWEWMKEEVRKLALGNLHLPGAFPVETMPYFMQHASALLVTLANEEIFAATVPSKLQAYMAAGRPILACLNGLGAEIVETAGAGIAIPAENGIALAEAVMRLYCMPASEREAMGARGRIYYERHFSHDMLMDKLHGHLRSVCMQEGRTE